MKMVFDISRKKQKGQALPIVLCFLVVGGLTIVTLLTFMRTGLNTGQLYEKKTKLQYAADAGVENAIWEVTLGGLELNEGQQTSLSNFGMNNSTVNVTIQRVAGPELETYIVSSTASGNSSTANIESLVVVGNLLFTYGLAADTDINLGDNNAIVGDIYLDDDATFTTGSGYSHTGNVTNGGLDFPSQEENSKWAESLKDEALVGGNWTSDYIIPSGMGYVCLGPLYIDGNLNIEMNNTVNITGTLYVEGVINVALGAEFVGGGSIISVGDMWLAKATNFGIENSTILASLTGDIYFKKEVDITAVLYAPYGSVIFDKDAIITGTIVADSIVTKKEGAFVFNECSMLDLNLPDDGAHIREWKLD